MHINSKCILDNAICDEILFKKFDERFTTQEKKTERIHEIKLD